VVKINPNKKTVISLIILFTMIFLTFKGRINSVNAQEKNLEIDGKNPLVVEKLIDKLEKQEYLRLIVKLNVPAQQQQAEMSTFDIQDAQDKLMHELRGTDIRVIHTYDHIPFMAIEVNQIGIEGLLNSQLIVGIEEDVLMKSELDKSAMLINAFNIWPDYSGAGLTVAILDTGVDKNHYNLEGKVVSEACYSTTSLSTNPPTTSLCPNGVSKSTATDSALPYISNCPIGLCDHGTHVAGIVASTNGNLTGIAKDANLIAVQVFSRINDTAIGSWSSDQIKGLERIYDLHTIYNIAAVNLSLGSYESYSSICDDYYSSYKAVVDLLRSVGIATIAASGNEGERNKISSPACISSVISVGASTYNDTVASFSNSAPFLDLLAPGNFIDSTIPNNQFASASGTSMAAPHVAAAFALIKDAKPDATIDEALYGLKNSGVSILDTRNHLRFPRIDIGNAINSLIHLKPGIPTNLQATDGTDPIKIILSWDYSDNPEYYKIYRNTIDSLDTAYLHTSSVFSNLYYDNYLTEGLIYYYWVKACNVSGCSDYSLSESGWLGTGTNLPAVPSGVVASDGEYNYKINISWNSVGGADYFQVYRNEIADLNTSSLIADLVEGLSFNDTNVDIEKEYYYWVKACQTLDEICSDYSTIDSGYLKEDFDIFLPMITKDYRSPILNGDFEEGQDGSWKEYSSKGWDLIVNAGYPYGVYPHSGDWIAWLGGDNNETSRISQSIKLSPGKPFLHIWIWTYSSDSGENDYFRLSFNGREKLTLPLSYYGNFEMWREFAFDLSTYESPVELVVEVTTNNSYISSVFVDDISMSDNPEANFGTFGDNQVFVENIIGKIR
jgi:subtilisin family serine protease